MKTYRFARLFTPLLLTLALVFAGCSDDDDDNGTGPGDGQGQMRMYMVDAPALYDAVNIVITEVTVHRAGSDDESGWIVINDTTQTHDLLELRNGAQAVLGTGNLDAGNYTQIRLKLGSGSNVVVAGVTHPLTIPSGMQSGLKLNHAFEIEEDVRYDLTLDFDAERSIHVTGNGVYTMNPVIRLVPTAASGAIRGDVEPETALAHIWTMAGSDTVRAVADDDDGRFTLMALPGGTYDVTVLPMAGAWRDTTIVGVVVDAGETTELGVIQLLPE